MSWEGDYSNGADGTCQGCGGETAEEWHAYCSDCYAEQQGWKRPARPAPGTPPASFTEGLALVRTDVRQLRADVQLLEDRLRRLEEAPYYQKEGGR